MFLIFCLELSAHFGILAKRFFWSARLALIFLSESGKKTLGKNSKALLDGKMFE